MLFGGLLFDLLRDGLDLDEVIRAQRSPGRWTELVDAMLRYVRRAEAVRVLLAMGAIDAAEACTRGEPTVTSETHPVVSGVHLAVAEAAAGIIRRMQALDGA